MKRSILLLSLVALAFASFRVAASTAPPPTPIVADTTKASNFALKSLENVVAKDVTISPNAAFAAAPPPNPAWDKARAIAASADKTVHASKGTILRTDLAIGKAPPPDMHAHDDTGLQAAAPPIGTSRQDLAAMNSYSTTINTA